MKPEDIEKNEDEVDDGPIQITGDVIGDTSYSERYVLKILLKFANLETLKDEVKEQPFEDDLCTLWDMTAERDVVLYLQKHDILNLFNFSLPVIDSPRIIEVIIGIIANMCCEKEALSALLKMDAFLTTLLGYIKSDDSLVLNQVIRLVNGSLYVTDEQDLAIWMDLFKNNDYPLALYLILKNSSHKDLLLNALENFNTICFYFNTEKFRLEFFNQFVNEGLESLTAAFTELVVEKDVCETQELERVLVIVLQIILNMIGFDKSPVTDNNKEDIVSIISNILGYYENKVVNLKEIDLDLVDLIDSTNTIVKTLNLNEITTPDKYFTKGYSIWKAMRSETKSNSNGSSFEDNHEELVNLSSKLNPPISTLLASYLEKCPEEELLKLLDEIGEHYKHMLNSVDEQMRIDVSKRTENYYRLKNAVDS